MLGNVLSWIFGSLSNICWFFVYIPQIKENYKNKSCNAVSFYLMLFWFMGDTLSSISAQYKNIWSVVLYVSFYNIFFDIMFLSQYIYYTFYELNEDGNQENQALLGRNYQVFKTIIQVLKNYEIQLILLYLFTIIFIDLVLNISHFPKRIIGEIYGWTSTIIFLSSRIPQIYLNYKRKSVRGLSFLTFSTIILANYLFLTSILINLIDLEKIQYYTYIILNLQWIIGSSITSLLDMTILYQFIKWGNNTNNI